MGVEELFFAEALATGAEAAAADAFFGGAVADTLAATDAMAGIGALESGAAPMLADTVGSGVFGGAVADTAPSWFSSAMPEIGGTLDSLTGAGFSSALPQASMLPEAMTSVPGAFAPEGVASLPTMGDPSMTVPGSPWEDLTTPFKQANSMLDKALATPEAQAVSKAGKLYNAGKTLDQMLNPPAMPQTVSGLRQQAAQPPQRRAQPPQRRGGLSQSFGNRNFNQYT